MYNFLKKHIGKILIFLFILLVIVLSITVSPYFLTLLSLLLILLIKLFINKKKSKIFELLNKYDPNINTSTSSKNSKNSKMTFINKIKNKFKKGKGSDKEEQTKNEHKLILNEKDKNYITKYIQNIIDDEENELNDIYFLLILFKIKIKKQLKIDINQDDVLSIISEILKFPEYKEISEDDKKQMISVLESYTDDVQIFTLSDKIKSYFIDEIDRSIILEFPEDKQLDIYYLRYLVFIIDGLKKLNLTDGNDKYVLSELIEKSKNKNHIIRYNNKHNIQQYRVAYNTNFDIGEDKLSNIFNDFIISNLHIFNKLIVRLNKYGNLINFEKDKTIGDMYNFGTTLFKENFNSCVETYLKNEHNYNPFDKEQMTHLNQVKIDDMHDSFKNCYKTLDPKNFNFYNTLIINAKNWEKEKKEKEDEKENSYNDNNPYGYSSYDNSHGYSSYDNSHNNNSYDDSHNSNKYDYYHNSNSTKKPEPTFKPEPVKPEQKQSNQNSNKSSLFKKPEKVTIENLSLDIYKNETDKLDPNQKENCNIYNVLQNKIDRQKICITPQNKRDNLYVISHPNNIKNSKCYDLANDVFKDVKNICDAQKNN